MHALSDDHPDNDPDNNPHDNYSDNNCPEDDCAENEYPLADAVGPYRNMLGWPATTYGWAIWVLAGQGMDAFHVPEHLGPHIRHVLTTLRLPHPIIAIPGNPPHWTFLSQPAAGLHAQYPLELANLNITHQPHGSRIELPPTRTPAGPLTWLEPPSFTRQPLPPYPAVAAAIIGTAGQRNTPRPETP